MILGTVSACERMAPVQYVQPSERMRLITICGCSPGSSGMSYSTGISVSPRTAMGRFLAKYRGTMGIFSRSMYSHTSSSVQLESGNTRMLSPLSTWLWNLFNSHVAKGESIRVFPLSNWTELDVWEYIDLEKIPIVPLYFAKKRPMAVRGETLIPVEHDMPLLPGEQPQMVMSRMRSLGCTYCTGAIRSQADTVPKIIQEMMLFRRSERENRVIDHDQEGSMEIKKREGYF